MKQSTLKMQDASTRLNIDVMDPATSSLGLRLRLHSLGYRPLTLCAPSTWTVSSYDLQVLENLLLFPPTMPLNTLRLNAQASSHPNDRITFIKPLALPPNPTPEHQFDYDTADTFLRAIAAQCLPIMKSHFLSVTTLEEHEPNREFIGRNFNNGEIIQLVLRSKSGGWLPFNMVQMVMMHELSHNTHMNHGKQFWKVRNAYTVELRALWSKGYTGEGFWGGGRRLSDMQNVMGNNIVDSEVLRDLPVCGGTYRSRRRKRKATQDMSWKEKRDRRIEKKFGKNGINLGEDEDKRMLLELGKKGPIGSKPRVAQSKRGKELRVAAALARFETNKQEVEALKKGNAIKDEEQSDSEEYEDADTGLDDALDTDGTRLLDCEGNSLVRICGDDDQGDPSERVQIKQEMEELEGLERYFPRVSSPENLIDGDRIRTPRGRCNDSESSSHRPSEAQVPSTPPEAAESLPSAHIGSPQAPHVPPTTSNGAQSNRASPTPPPAQNPTAKAEARSSEIICPVCSLSNPSLPLTCSACTTVLHPDRDKNRWACSSEQCRTVGYLNAGDVGMCGLCGTKRRS